MTSTTFCTSSCTPSNSTRAAEELGSCLAVVDAKEEEKKTTRETFSYFSETSAVYVFYVQQAEILFPSDLSLNAPGYLQWHKTRTALRVCSPWEFGTNKNKPGVPT